MARICLSSLFPAAKKTPPRFLYLVAVAPMEVCVTHILEGLKIRSMPRRRFQACDVVRRVDLWEECKLLCTYLWRYNLTRLAH